ncbi:MAG: TolC family protein [Flavobacterium sp.]|nr:TolC family protein [Candidatus Neoflavobacterium equi]
MNKLYFYISLLFVTQVSFGQQVLSSQQAVAVALKNNFDIVLAKNVNEALDVNTTWGNAGFLPDLTANFTNTNNVQNQEQTQSNGEVRKLNNAKNNNASYGVTLGWTIFDGLGMFTRYEQLNTLKEQGETQLQTTVLTTVSDVLEVYYNIVQQEHILTALDSTLLISNERLRLAENRYKIGKASKLEVLNVQVDLNADRSLYLKQKETIQNLKTQLNQLMNVDLTTPFEVIKETTLDESLELGALLDASEKQNPNLQLLKVNKRLADLELKNTKATRYPTVRLTSGYNFSRSESSLGFVTSSNANGFNYGVTASLNLFDGFEQRRKERVAKLQIENSTLQFEKQKVFLQSQLIASYQTYKTNLDLAAIEDLNEKIAKENMDITLAKHKIGTINTVEFRTAQENYINAVARNNSAKFQSKLAEIQLKELSGTLSM